MSVFVSVYGEERLCKELYVFVNYFLGTDRRRYRYSQRYQSKYTVSEAQRGCSLIGLRLLNKALDCPYQ